VKLSILRKPFEEKIVDSLGRVYNEGRTYVDGQIEIYYSDSICQRQNY
jgi:hypothetical protein